MSLRVWNVAVLAAAAAMWLATGTRAAKPVFADDARSAQVRALEADVATHPSDAGKVETLAQAYLDNRAPGLAVSLVEGSPENVQSSPRVEHVYARALVEQGRNQEALVAERRVLDACGELDAAAVAKGCDASMLASATRRADILDQLVTLGVEDAQAQPEEASLAYRRATREAHAVVASQ